MKLNSKMLGGASFALMAFAVAAPAQAQTVPLYSGGGTLAEKVYRDIFNCYGNSGPTDAVDATKTELEIGLAGQAVGCNGVTGYNEGVEALYVGVGSGNGLNSFVDHDPVHMLDGTVASPKHGDKPPVASTSDFGPFYGAGAGTNWVVDNNTTTRTTGTTTGGYTGPAFPKVSFAGSDDPLTASKLAFLDTTKYGAAIQIPALMTPVAVPYSPAAGTWNEQGKDLHTQGASGKLQLTTNVLCGIFTGAITDWSSSEIQAINGANKPLGSGTIHVTVRGDGSGTTFLFTNALIHQCGSQSNPRAHITHPVPDQWLTDNSISNVAGAGPDAIGASNNNFFINVNNAAHLPGNFVTASGSGAVKAAINGTAGSIGYISPDFTANGRWIPLSGSTPAHLQPFDSTGPKAANLQTFATSNAGTTPLYKVAGYMASTQAVMTGITPPKFTAASCPVGTAQGQASDGICAHNPLNWGQANPTPAAAGAYPIGGFTFIDLYTCYASANDVKALVGTTAGSLGLWRWYFGSTTENGTHVKNELLNNGFAQVPAGYITANKKLMLTDLKTKISTPRTAKTGCALVTGSGA